MKNNSNSFDLRIITTSYGVLIDYLQKWNFKKESPTNLAIKNFTEVYLLLILMKKKLHKFRTLYATSIKSFKSRYKIVKYDNIKELEVFEHYERPVLQYC